MADFDIQDLLRKQVQAAPTECIQEALLTLLTPYFRPTFGAGKAAEHEVSALRALEHLGVVPSGATELDLVMKLRVTRTKARALLYRAQLADVQDMQALDDHVRQLLANPRVGQWNGRDGDGLVWFLDVPFPLVADRVQQLVREQGFISDGSFSPNLIKLPTAAYGSLVARLIPEENRERVLSAARQSVRLSQAADLRALLSETMAQLGKRVAGELGGKLANHIAGSLYDLLKTGSVALFNYLPLNGDTD